VLLFDALRRAPHLKGCCVRGGLLVGVERKGDV
jgi:hypothetical protein